tara:strand:- start:1795 stop:2991 length:1197 start_codon:yes stop_codon:yes gene_type:complete
MIEWLKSCADSLADDKARIEIREEMKTLSLAHNEYNKIKRKNSYIGFCLSNGANADLETIQQVGERISVKIRLADLNDSCLPDPCDDMFSDEEQKRLTSCHPTTFSEKPLIGGERPPRFGDKIVCKFYGESPDFMGRQRDLRYSYPSVREKFNYKCALKTQPASYQFDTSNYQTLEQQTDSNLNFSNPWGLKPKKGIYNGAYLPKGTEVLNGYPVHGKTILAVPDTTYFKPHGSGKILKDWIPSFERLCKAYSDKFSVPGEPPVKLWASGIRDFQGQLDIRQRGIDQGICGTMDGPFGKVEPGQTKGCGSAVPGTSDHGWGQAVDIKHHKTGNYLGKDDPEAIWLYNDGKGREGWFMCLWWATRREYWHMQPFQKKSGLKSKEERKNFVAPETVIKKL